MESSVEPGGERRREQLAATERAGLTVAEAFTIQEYVEAANAYFKGVEIGYTVLKYYITLNAVFFTLIAAASSKNAALSSLSELVTWIPAVPLLVAVLLYSSLRYYVDHLENCRARCQEIEEKFDGALFSRLGGIVVRGKKKGFTAARGLRMVVIIVSILWLMIWWRYLVSAGVISNDLLQRSWEAVGSFLN